MAANDYFSSYRRRQDDPLPPVPVTTSQSQSRPLYENHSTPSISPVSSPFDDNAYPTSYRHNNNDHSNISLATGSYSDTKDYSYNSPYTYGNQSSDPFADQNAIPLQNNSAHNMEQMKQGDAAGAWDPENPQPLNQQRRRRRSSSNHHGRKKKSRITWVVYILTTVQVAVFIGELIRNAILTKSPIEIHPSFNFLIGPSPYVLINMGARYQPCMHNVRDITDANTTISWVCPNGTSSTAFDCSLSDVCGFGGVPYQAPGTNFRDRSHEPNQWWRFIVPMFLHAGLIHIGFNMALQLTLGRDMEKLIGPWRFALVYFSSGIFGFVLGGNYAAPLIASTGASGALFGILALHLLDLLYNWSTRRSPWKDLLFILLDVALAFVLGLLPGLDNFSHIGGFMMGLVLGVCVLHSPPALRRRIGEADPPYRVVAQDGKSGDEDRAFVKQPIGFFKGRKPAWWAWWLARAVSLVVVLVGFILLLNNFYVERKECSWCYHLTCLPVSNWCEIGKPKFETIPANETRKRDLFGLDFANPAAMPVQLW